MTVICKKIKFCRKKYDNYILMVIINEITKTRKILFCQLINIIINKYNKYNNITNGGILRSIFCISVSQSSMYINKTLNSFILISKTYYFIYD